MDEVAPVDDITETVKQMNTGLVVDTPNASTAFKALPQAFDTPRAGARLFCVLGKTDHSPTTDMYMTSSKFLFIFHRIFLP